MKKFGNEAKKSPQTAYATFIKSLQFEKSFLQKFINCPFEQIDHPFDGGN